MNSIAKGVWPKLTVACLVLFCLAQSANAEMSRTLEMRNGATLRASLSDATLTWRTLSRTGEITERDVKLSEIESLQIVPEPATAQVAEIRRLIADLNNPKYALREEAQNSLIKRGGPFRWVVEQTEAPASSIEFGWRLNEVLTALPEESQSNIGSFDEVVLSNGETLQGEASGWETTVAYRGQQLKLDRKTIRALTVAEPKPPVAAETVAPTFNRIEWDEKPSFLAGLRKVNFDRSPDGAKVEVGQDIGDLYTAWGCILSTSVKDSVVTVARYNVGGPSGKFCAANRDPIYEGTLTIRFCIPGRPDLPASIHRLGFWTSHISPEGTALRAFDARDRFIGEVKTAKNRRDYLSFESSTPIAYVKIVPDVKIDPDFAIDDLVFDGPFALAGGGAADQFTVLLRNGERILADDLQRDDDSVKVSGCFSDDDSIRFPLDQVALISPPITAATKRPLPFNCWARLQDGSILKARGGLKVKPINLSDFEVNESNLQALWGSTVALKLPAEPPNKGSIAVVDTANETMAKDWKFGEYWLESKELEAFAESTYDRSPSIWFTEHQIRPAEAGVLTLTNGDELVLSDAGFELVSWSVDEVLLKRDGTEWKFSWSEIASFLLPTS